MTKYNQIILTCMLFVLLAYEVASLALGLFAVGRLLGMW